jgi:hypothetical protein
MNPRQLRRWRVEWAEYPAELVIDDYTGPDAAEQFAEYYSTRYLARCAAASIAAALAEGERDGPFFCATVQRERRRIVNYGDGGPLGEEWIADGEPETFEAPASA